VTGRLGASPLGDGSSRFLVWAPNASRVEVELDGGRIEPLAPCDRGYHAAVVHGVGPGARYRYRLDGGEGLPDPASAWQPDGVHGPSAVVDLEAFRWTDHRWRGPEPRDLVIYEMHVGTFSPPGTFDGAIAVLDEVRELGVTAVEPMPIAQFPGGRNWGYDGVFPFAVHDTYGGPEGFDRFVDACHARGLAVILDVVYNHLGPEGNVLARFGPYFTERYWTPWGSAINFGGRWSDDVRRYFTENAMRWLEDHHVDGLRLDAIHGIVDTTATPFLAGLAGAVERLGTRLGRRLLMIAESGLNDPRVVAPRDGFGLGMDAQWSDDFHHAWHALLTGERMGYYVDFGDLQQVAQAYAEGFVLDGRYSRFRQRRFGATSRDVPADRFVVCMQNHDQVGNRAGGERLSSLVSFEQTKLAAGALLLSPYVPLLFMGEEYGEQRPFPYFVSHTDPGLIEAVRQGRRREFDTFEWAAEPPDPQSQATFDAARLDRSVRRQGRHRVVWDLYRELLAARRGHPALANLSKDDQEVGMDPPAGAIWLHRWAGPEEALVVLGTSTEPAIARVAVPAGTWTKLLDSADRRWDGPGGTAPDRLVGGDRRSVPLAGPGFVLYLEEREV
jgi:maltooligosyltrehalose trehalohydrolase